MHRLAAMNLALAGAQPTKEGFQIVVGAVTFGPSVAGEEPWPALPESGVDMRDHLGLIGAVSGVRFQLRQKILDLAFDIALRGMGLTVFGRVEPSLQLDQPVPLALETAILRRKRSAPLDHGQQLSQDGMAPFFWLRLSEASKRVKSSKTRRPPRAKGGLLPSVKVARINSA